MYRLTTSMPYLLNRLGVRLGVLFSRRIASYGLTLPMYRVLAALSERADQKLGNISEMTTIDLSTMSRLIGAMADSGWVSRVRLPNDERTVRINLTDKGAELANILMREAQHYEDVVVSRLKPAVISRLKADLIAIYAALDVLEEELVAAAPPAAEHKGNRLQHVGSAAGAKSGDNTRTAIKRDRAGKGGSRSSFRS